MVTFHLSSRRKGAKWESGHGPCPSYPDQWRKLAMVILYPSSRRKRARWESGHGLCPSDPDQWRNVVMVTPSPHPSSKKKGGWKEAMVSVCSPLEKERKAWTWSFSQHSQKEGRKAAMVSTLLLLRSGGEWSSCPSPIPLPEGRRNDTMTSL